eukprot:4603916-Pyramimonas_sp.AAC.1
MCCWVSSWRAGLDDVSESGAQAAVVPRRCALASRRGTAGRNKTQNFESYLGQICWAMTSILAPAHDPGARVRQGAETEVNLAPNRVA